MGDAGCKSSSVGFLYHVCLKGYIISYTRRYVPYKGTARVSASCFWRLISIVAVYMDSLGHGRLGQVSTRQVPDHYQVSDARESEAPIALRVMPFGAGV